MNWSNKDFLSYRALHTVLDLVLEALLFVPIENKENDEPVKDSSSSYPVQYCQNCRLSQDNYSGRC